MNIALTGFMGTGKTAVGNTLAAKLGYRFIDLDHLIVDRVGCSIPEIFSRDGEDGFRDCETTTLRSVSAQENVILSTGGGVVLRDENMRILERSAIIVLLTASPETIYARTKHDTNRPLLQVPDPMNTITQLLADRQKQYERCSFSVSTDERSPADIATEIVQKCQSYLEK